MKKKKNSLPKIYPKNEDGTITTPDELYYYQADKTRGFDVDETPPGWRFPGQIAPADVNSILYKHKYEEFVKTAIGVHNSKQQQSSKEVLEYVRVLKVMHQGCAGVNYYLTFDVKKLDDNSEKTYQAIIYERWNGCVKVTYFKEKPSDDAQGASYGESSASDSDSDCDSVCSDETPTPTEPTFWMGPTLSRVLAKSIATNAASVTFTEEGMLEHDDAKRRKMKDSEDNLGSFGGRIDWKMTGRMVMGYKEHGMVLGCSLSLDGDMFATCDLSRYAKVWDLTDYGIDPPCVLKGHEKGVNDVTYSPSEEHIATASDDHTAMLWKTKEGGGGWSSVETFKGHEDSVTKIAFHPSEKLLGTASFDKTWRLWDIATGKEVLRLEEEDGHDSWNIAFHCGGSLAASCSSDDTVAHCWDLRTGRSICAFEGHDGKIFDLSFSPNGYQLATGGQDKACLIWDLRKGKYSHKISDHSDIISQVKFGHPEGCFLFTGSHDKTVKAWSSSDFKLVRNLMTPPGEVTSLAVAKDGQFVAAIHDMTATTWSARTY